MVRDSPHIRSTSSHSFTILSTTYRRITHDTMQASGEEAAQLAMLRYVVSSFAQCEEVRLGD